MTSIYRERVFDPDSTDPQHVIAAALARYDGFGVIAPAHWWKAGRAVTALKAKGLLADRRRLPRASRKAQP